MQLDRLTSFHFIQLHSNGLEDWQANLCNVLMIPTYTESPMAGICKQANIDNFSIANYVLFKKNYSLHKGGSLIVPSQSWTEITGLCATPSLARSCNSDSHQ